MDKLFKEHQVLEEKDFSEIWKNCLFIFDTNVLLNFYRLPETAQNDLFEILSNDKINSRVWLPFQVALEYTNNRLDVISDQKNKFNSVRRIINEGIENTENVYNTLKEKLDKLQLKKRHSVINPGNHINSYLVNDVVEKLNLFLTELDKLDKNQPDVIDNDEIKDRISKIFNNKIGKGFTEEELKLIFKDGELRYKDKIPSGYKDDSKIGFYLHNEIKYIRKYGDLVVWKEIIKKSKEDACEYIILISDDTKEDWWQEKRGKKMGPRYELLDEIYNNSPELKVFYMYDTSGFMKFSKEYLEIQVNEQSIIETKDILEFNQSVNEFTTIDNDIISITDFIRQVGESIPIKIGLSGNFGKAPFINLPHKQFRLVLMEILSNVYLHSSDQKVTVRVQYSENYFIIEFENATNIKNISVPNSNFRGNGVEFIKSFFEKHRCGYVETVLNDGKYQVKLYISKEHTTA